MAREVPRWCPDAEPSKFEARILKRLKRVKKLFAMLRLYRLELFDDAFQTELADMYRGTGAGRPELPPAQLCMALLLQAYTGISDAEAVEMTVMDARWRMVLDHLDSNEPLFGQGTLQRFRERLIEHNLDQRLLERTVEIAKESGAFDWKQIPRGIVVAMDSRPFECTGRVEDIFNLLGHAARKLAVLTARLLDIPFGQLCMDAGAPVLAASSIKAYLDVDWSKPEQKDEAFAELFNQVEAFCGWLTQHVDLTQAPLTPYIHALVDICEQNVDITHRAAQIRQETVSERRVSVEEEEARHGRKTKNIKINGYKQHIAVESGSGIVLGVNVAPANRPEYEAAQPLADAISRQGFIIDELDIDRGYLASPLVDAVESEGGRVNCKPWPTQGLKGLFSKNDFAINLEAMEATCPAGHTVPIELGRNSRFPTQTCTDCSMRNQCTTAKKSGRLIRIGRNEKRQARLRAEQASTDGRRRLRRRTVVEHRLAHMARRQGPKARYVGVRKNQFDAHRMAVLMNFEVLQRSVSA